MKLLMFYRRGDQSQAKAQDYAADYQRMHRGVKIDMAEADSADSQSKAELYGIMSYPAILALADNGSLLQLWQGEPLPLMKELDFYSQNQG